MQHWIGFAFEAELATTYFAIELAYEKHGRIFGWKPIPYMWSISSSLISRLFLGGFLLSGTRFVD
ncbi:hypothetical protein ACS0TY_022925 [Phlomoides rotata]